MSFKPTNTNKNAGNDGEKKEFVPIVPEEGLQAVQIGMLVNLGLHKKLPKFAKDSSGKVREQTKSGKDKIIVPKEGKDLEQKVAVYVDLLDQTHDFGEELGVKNIRLPLHQVSRGMSEGLNLTTVAPRTPEGKYIKGKPWILAGTSQFYKIAGVVKVEGGKKVSDIIFDTNTKKNPHLNDISMLLGLPFMMNLEVKVADKDGNTYVNSKLKSPVPMMKGMTPAEALVPAISISFDDDDLMEPKDELGGACKMDFLRVADLRKIVLADDYEGSKIQDAIREREDEDELIKKAKEIREAIIDNDKELQECLEEIERRKEAGESVSGEDGEGSDNAEAGGEVKTATPVTKAKAAKPAVKKTPQPSFADIDDDIPF